ncbi:zinc finger, CCHC-type, retrotransposon gag domain protein [Tanacetum coccineum]
MVTTRRNSDDDVPNFEAMITAVVANALPNVLAALRLRQHDHQEWVMQSTERWKAHLRTQVGGDAFADTCTWVAFREIFYNRYFPASEQQRYEREYGSICQLDRENSGEYMERFTRLASFVGATAGDAQRQARTFQVGGYRMGFGRIENTECIRICAGWRHNLPPVTLSYCMKWKFKNCVIDMVIRSEHGTGQHENKGRYDQGPA